MLENIVPLLDNATCSVMMLIVLWRFDLSVRHLADLQSKLAERLIEMIEGVSDE
jgi:hypothetical protein